MLSHACVESHISDVLSCPGVLLGRQEEKGRKVALGLSAAVGLGAAGSQEMIHLGES